MKKVLIVSLVSLVALSSSFLAGRLTSENSCSLPKKQSVVCIDGGVNGEVMVEEFPTLRLTRLSDGASMMATGTLEEVLANNKQVACPK